MPITCPACGLISADAVSRCDCGRALAPGVVDDRPPPRAAVVKRRRWPYLGASLLVAALAAVFVYRRWIDPPTRIDRARAAIHALCGAAYRDDFNSDGRVVNAGCGSVDPRAKGVRIAWGSFGRSVETGRVVSVFAAALGFSDDLDAPQRFVLRTLDGVLDGAQRDAARAALGRVVLRHDAPDVTVGDVTIHADTGIWRPNVPWERVANLSIRFDSSTSAPRAPAPSSGFAPFDAATRARWEAVCRDDSALGAILGTPPRAASSKPYTGGRPESDQRFASGRDWLQCDAFSLDRGAASVRLVAIWDPATERLDYVEIVQPDGGRAAIAAIVDQLVAPLLTTAQADHVRAVARAEAGAADLGDLYVDPLRGDLPGVFLTAP